MMTNGIDKDKERKLIDLLYDLNAKVATIDERTKALCSSDKEDKGRLDRLSGDLDKKADKSEVNSRLSDIEKRLSAMEDRISRLETYFKIIGAGLGMILMGMLTQIDKLVAFIRSLR